MCLFEGAVRSICPSMPRYEHPQFVYHQTMNIEHRTDFVISRIAAAIGEPARVRILYCLLDGHSRTSTELAVVANVSPSTASAHLNRLRRERLIKVFIQGRHRYYSLEGPNVAQRARRAERHRWRLPPTVVPNTPSRLRDARTCYDHLAGRVGVLLHNRFKTLGWLKLESSGMSKAYDLTAKGSKEFEGLGIDLIATRTLRRRFAYACPDWSERRSLISEEHWAQPF